MILTKELVNFLTPTHDRAGCSDAASDQNGFYDYEDSRLNGVAISRTFKPAPRCTRCLLLNHIGAELPPELRLHVTVELKQPKFRIEQLD